MCDAVWSMVFLRRIDNRTGQILYWSNAGNWNPDVMAARRFLRTEAEKLQGELVPIFGHIDLEPGIWL